MLAQSTVISAGKPTQSAILRPYVPKHNISKSAKPLSHPILNLLTRHNNTNSIPPHRPIPHLTPPPITSLHHIPQQHPRLPLLTRLKRRTHRRRQQPISHQHGSSLFPSLSSSPFQPMYIPMTNRPQPPPLRPILHKQEPQPPAQSLTRDRHRRPRATIFALAVHDFLHGFGRTQHVPGVHAETDFVHLAVGLCPFDDLAVGMGAELVGVSEEGEAFGAGW